MKPKILTVDDSMSIRIIVKNTLKKHNAEVIEAENGEDGLLKAAEIKPDLILLDVTMPKMTGTEMLAKLRSDDSLKETPVIMLTAEGSRKIVMEIAHLGVRDYIVKPFKEDTLLERILKVIPLEEKIETLELPKSINDTWKTLIIEDKDAIYNEMESIIKTNNPSWSITRANTIKEALTILKKDPAHVIFLDLNFPDNQAYEFLTSFKSLKNLANSKIFSLLRKNDEDGKNKAQTQGASGFIYKPIDNQQVKDELNNVLNLSAKQDALQLNGKIITVLFNNQTLESLKSSAKPKFEELIDEGAKEISFDLTQLQDTDMDTMKVLLDLIQFAQQLSYNIKMKADKETEQKIKNSYADFTEIEFFSEQEALANS